MKITSTQEKCKRLAGLTDEDLSDWERGFVSSVNQKAAAGAAGQVCELSEKQLDKLDELYTKHFG